MPVIIEGPTVERLNETFGEWIKANTIAAAERVLKEEVASGFDPQPDVITDGKLSRDYLLVKPYGKIEFVARIAVADAVLWALAELIRRSPIGPAKYGHYKDDHFVLLNGAQVTGNIRVALTGLKSGDHVQIVNSRPYARKLEGATGNRKTGRGKRKPSSRQAPAGIYRPVLRALAGRYSKSLFVDYKLVKLNMGVRVWGDQGGRWRKVGKGRGAKWYLDRSKVKRVQRDQVYPCLDFWVRPSQATVH
ncbi:MAG: hypothetical protein U1E23_09565 [Reyranellaceae bacterium]